MDAVSKLIRVAASPRGAAWHAPAAAAVTVADDKELFCRVRYLVAWGD